LHVFGWQTGTHLAGKPLQTSPFGQAPQLIVPVPSQPSGMSPHSAPTLWHVTPEVQVVSLVLPVLLVEVEVVMMSPPPVPCPPPWVPPPPCVPPEPVPVVVCPDPAPLHDADAATTDPRARIKAER
jgi:hypothetical protein